MKVIPKESYKMLGSSIFVKAGHVYDAEPAANQPEYQERGLIFITNAENDGCGLGFLLDSNDYTVIEA